MWFLLLLSFLSVDNQEMKIEGKFPFQMENRAFLRHNEQILSFIDLSFSFFTEIFQ